MLTKCRWCGKEFETANSKIKYCSEACRRKRKSMAVSEYIRHKRNMRKPKTDNNIRLARISRICREKGISYGQAVATGLVED